MRNIIKADLYRIFRGKGVYIVLIILVALVILMATTGGAITTGVDYQSTVIMDEMNSPEMGNMNPSELTELFFVKPTGAQAPFRAMETTDSILYLILPLLIFIAVVDFSTGSAKNILASGISRAKYYSAKLILSGLFCTLLFAFYVVLFTITATTIRGFGGDFNAEFIVSVFETFLPQLYLCLAATCVGTFFIFLLRSGAFVGVYIAYLLVPSILIIVLTLVDDWFKNLFDYELVILIGKAAFPDAMADGGLIKAILVGTVYLFAAVIGGYAIFRKAEVK